jgi:predicted ferric reductase
LFYIGFFVTLFFHAPNFWKWFIAPGFIFIIEALQRFRSSYDSDCGATYIEKGIILPSRVIHLVIKRPSYLDYNPGDYVFVRIPAVAKYEWHPFTISSAPEQEGI